MTDEIHGLKSRLIMDERFYDAIRSLENSRLPNPISDSTGQHDLEYHGKGKVEQIEKSLVYTLNAASGYRFITESGTAISGYSDAESIYEMMVGRAVSAAHSLVYINGDRYLPLSFVSLKFVTHSEEVAQKMQGTAILSDHIARDTAIAVAKDKMEFLDKYCVGNSVLFIDGPLIAGDDYTTFMKQIERFCQKGIVSVFFVGNSSSCMVVDNSDSLIGKFNSDSHWANSILKTGERTAFYAYTDEYNTRNAKAFCYIKFSENGRIVRIELPLQIYSRFKTGIDDILNAAFYMLLAQGSIASPQIRLIAVAQMYAKETLKLIDIQREMSRIRIQSLIYGIEGRVR